ncbi:MAG: YkvA family protein [Chloroflexaceae bacterium]
MLKKFIPNLFHPRYWQQMVGELTIVWKLVRNNRVPLYTKTIPGIVLAYLIIPIDVIPDFLPLLGQIDDLAILMLALRLFVRLAPGEVVKGYEQQMQTDMQLLS